MCKRVENILRSVATALCICGYGFVFTHNNELVHTFCSAIYLFCVLYIVFHPRSIISDV